MIDSIFILSGLGEVLIEKHYRHGTSRSLIADLFWERATSRRNNQDEDDREDEDDSTSNGVTRYSSVNGEAEDEIPPVVELGNETNRFAVHVKRGDLTFVGGVSRETPPMMAVEFLHSVADVLTDYLGTPDEIKIKDAFSTVYQILDEMMDGGMPLVTEFNALRGMIAPPTVANKVKQVMMMSGGGLSSVLPTGAVSTVPWRDKTVSYMQNEIFLDVEEYLDCVLTGDDDVLSADVRGSIKVTAKLSGMPECLLSFEDHTVLGDVAFHPCVRVDRWEREKVLSFIPPDGAFELMSYRAAPKNVSPAAVADSVPFYCRPSITVGQGAGGPDSSAQGLQGRIEVLMGPRKRGFTPVSPLASLSSPSSAVEDVVVRLPLPTSAKFLQAKGTEGKVSFMDRTCVWTVGKLDLDKTALRLTGSFTLPQPVSSPASSQSSLSSPKGISSPSPMHMLSTTCSLDFTVTARPVSGLKVGNFEIANLTYKYFKGVKSVLKGGEFQIRC